MVAHQSDYSLTFHHQGLAKVSQPTSHCLMIVLIYKGQLKSFESPLDCLFKKMNLMSLH